MTSSEETDRMKIEIVAGYVTTAYTNMVVLLVTVFLAVFVALIAPLIASQVTLIEFVVPLVIVESFVLFAIVGQRMKFDRRMDYLDDLIEQLEATPRKPICELKTILAEIRRA
jgi:hypothetical protein